MLASEFSEFEAIIRRLEKVFAKKIDDETMQAYWGALKDQTLAVFTRFAERHERYGKFFPKPSELRAKEDKLPEVQGGKDDATFRQGEESAIRNLEDLRRTNLEAWFRRLGDCNATRLVELHGSDAIWFDLPTRSWRLRS